MFKNKELLYNYFIPGWICIGIGLIDVVSKYFSNNALNNILSIIILILFILFIIVSIKNFKSKQKTDEYTYKLHVKTRSQMMRYTIISLCVLAIIGIIYTRTCSSFSIPFIPSHIVCLLGIYDLLYYFIYTHLEKEDFV